MTDFLNQATRWFSGVLPSLNNETIDILLTLLTVILAVIACFRGYCFFSYFIDFTGFLAGCLLGYTIGDLFTDEAWILLGSALAGGLLLGFLAIRFYQLGAFLITAIPSSLVACGLLSLVFPAFSPMWNCAGGLLIGILAGILVVWLQRPIIIIATGFFGAMLSARAFLTLIRFQNIYAFYGLVFVLTVAGICCQFIRSRR